MNAIRQRLAKGVRDHRGFLVFLLAFGFLRTAVADWNPIPSGSMRPTLQEGDVVLVDRLAYDLKVPLTDVSLRRLGEPRRGDVVTFISPRDGERLIKRIVALPGDTVAMRDGVLVLNGVPARYDALETAWVPLDTRHRTRALRAREHADASHAVQFYPDLASPLRSFGPVTVPPDHYWMLGDARDNSADSRVYGPVARERLIGRAHRVLVSADLLDGWRPRWERWVERIE